ncbi:MAG: DUF3160 domain-containing protein [Candidatus Omnitrophica bacterium]|nr:DUF3160 domain-containing protein [Candidatus Omnitrophota bacterium]
MNAKLYQLLLFAISATALHPGLANAQGNVNLAIKPAGAQIELSWPSRWKAPSGATVYPVFQVQKSADLNRWDSVTTGIREGKGGSYDALRLTLDPAGPTAFYRVVGNIEQVAPGQGGAEVFGYGSAFSNELERIGRISPQDFANRYTLTNEYLPGITWDPTQARFWDNFNANPAFHLNDDELAVFKQFGFVVSERLGSYSFPDAFYRIYSGDLPVFVSADAVLQAWHRSYDSVLEELEEVYLSPTLGQILDGMAAKIPETWQQYQGGALKDSILDADFFLTVARSLLAGVSQPSLLNQDARVSAALAAINSQQLQDFDLFGRLRTVDFSQFKVRGHYEASEALKRYFRAMMWCGRIDLRIAGNPDEASPRELGTAVILDHLLNQSGQFYSWAAFDWLLQAFVGWTDSMTFGQLNDVLAAAGVQSPAGLPDLASLENLQAEIEQGQVGVQNIRGDFYNSPMGPDQIRLPRSFTVMGQKFIPDSWALSKVVYDDIIWDGNKVLRRIPSALDVAFSVFGNDQVVPELVARMMDSDGRAFRDGLPYAHNLAAARAVIDQHTTEAWNSNIYMSWLAALRELSAPTTDPSYPQAMQTRAWAMKSLNAQLASWTQLRHDTILYAKQSYTGGIICSYPDGFVEPVPAFWGRLGQLADLAANLVAALPLQGIVTVNREGWPWPKDVNLAGLKQGQVYLFRSFANTMMTLREIARKELAQEPLSPDETAFLQDLIERQDIPYFGVKEYSGWYPRLFYNNIFEPSPPDTNQGSDKWDALVADVHTDVPAPIVNDPGCVLHEGVGNVHLLMIAIDNGPDRMVYAGPVLSHYEFEMPGVTRKSDSEWKADIKAGNLPPSPEWTRSYLVPGTYQVPDYIE